MTKTRRTKGLGSISQAAKGGWKGAVSIDGKRKYFYGKTKKEAEAKRKHLLAHPEEVRAKRAAANRNGVSADAAKGGFTVSAIAEAWLEYKRNALKKPHRPKTAGGYRDHLRLHVNDATIGIGGRDARTLVSDDVRMFIDSLLRAKSLTPNTVRGVHSLLRMSFEHAVSQGKVDANPVSLADRPDPETKRIRELTEAEVKVIVNHLRDASAGDRARWWIAIYMGLRPGEAIAIEESAIDWDKKTLHVYQQLQQDSVSGRLVLGPTKSDTSDRLLTMPDFIVNALHERMAERDGQRQARLDAGKEWQRWQDASGREPNFVFTQANGQPIRPRLDTTRWKQLLVGAGLYTLHPSKLDRNGAAVKVPRSIPRYACRHYAATWMLGKKIEMQFVSRYLGHADVGLTMRTYAAKSLPGMETLGQRIGKAFAVQHATGVEWDEELGEEVHIW
ncbi:site-specific integrase [Arthrobacter crystallopoietes]|uniref:Site-specific recombinase XerD n=1 Tax=Crystallibacter crystallopoietes TaxID=37928 RepID=A0A1H1BD26_9MICC|nr:tyrosine-type recombinase/integrase [Arthrobacter crystallopoietes]AUI51184.1 hypothetical protein AC20117_10590 [Arthrobacter crystallopoietes]SDQ49888.1 Site-specific recombinase XerD [Arthrobacter crystallopoietes]